MTLSYDQRGTITLVVFVAIIGFIFLIGLSWIGCPFLGKPNLQIDNINGVTGFTGTKVSFQIYNNGDATARNVAVTIIIFKGEDWMHPTESKHLFIGNVEPGELKEITTDMKTTPSKDSHIRIFPVTEQG